MASAGFIAGFVATAESGEWRKFAAGAGPLRVDGTAHCHADCAFKGDAAPRQVGMFAHAGGRRGVGLGHGGRHPTAGRAIEFDAGQGDAISDATGATGLADRIRKNGGTCRDCLAYPQLPTAPQAVQKSQPSFLMTVMLPHSVQSDPWVTLTWPFSRGVSRMPMSRVG